MSFRKQVLVLTGVLCSVAFAEPAYSVTIYTPEGRPVNAMQLSGTPYYTREWAQYWINWFPLDATIIGDPTRAYNCHGYAWAKTEGIGDYWIQDNEELKFFNDGSYANDGQASYLSCSQSQATHGCYEPDSDHSVRVIQNSYPVAASGSQTWVSKWNDGPLVRHAPWDDYYAAVFRLNYGYNPSTQFVKLKTSHPGTLSSYPKTWIGAGGQTHTITGNITVPSGVTLQVNPGSTIVFGSSYKLLTYGNFAVSGTAGEAVPIDGQGYSRTSMDNAMIVVQSGGTANIQYADFKNAAYELTFWQNSGAVTVQNCTFTDFGYTSDSKAVSAYYSTGTINISNSSFTGSGLNGIGVYATNTGTNVTISGNTFTTCRKG